MGYLQLLAGEGGDSLEDPCSTGTKVYIATPVWHLCGDLH